MDIRPNPGPQTAFLQSAADIVLYGGSAGSGKTWGLLLEPLRHVRSNPYFSAVFFRRNTTQIRNPGGLWDQAIRLYPQLGGIPVNQPLEIRWPAGGKVKFAHLEHETTKLDWHGAEIPLICCQEDEPVRMADGSLKAVRDICVGDLVTTLQGPRAVRFVGNRRREQCVKAVIRTADGQQIGRQVHSLSHKILTQSGAWQSYLDKCADLSDPLISEPIQIRAHGKYRERNQTMPRSDRPHRDSPSSGLEPIQGCEPRQRDRLVSSVSAADTVPQSPESGSEASACGHQTLPPPALVAFAIALHGPSARLSARRRAPTCTYAPDAGAYVRCGSSVADCRDRCSAGQSPCDELAHLEADSDRGNVQRPSDVAAQSRTDWLLDDLDTTQTSNRHRLCYVHPYSGIEQTAEADTVPGSCEMIPCGQRWVIDLTIADTSHYVSSTGIVNKNCFDELTTFSASQFWYLFSRNRSMSGVRGYIRATCNPDADSWVATLIAWWIDQDTGYPITARSGVVRWFIRVEDDLIWADSAAELVARVPGSMPKSLTFIAAKLDDNPALNAVDPGYRANLMAMSRVERERLLGGNWKIRPAAGMYFRRGWCEVVDAAPAGMTEIRGWDLAATEADGMNDPDWTTGTKIGRTIDGRYVVTDHVWAQGSPHKVDRLIYNTASADGRRVQISLPQDPGQAGKSQVQAMIRSLAGFTVRSSPETGDKITRFGPFSAQAEAGNVAILRGAWNERFMAQLEGFPEGLHDDDADSTSRAFNALMAGRGALRISDATFASTTR